MGMKTKERRLYDVGQRPARLACLGTILNGVPVPRSVLQAGIIAASGIGSGSTTNGTGEPNTSGISGRVGSGKGCAGAFALNEYTGKRLARSRAASNALIS
jgi:hypothetical protein